MHIVPYRMLWSVTVDPKAFSSITLYEMAKKEVFFMLTTSKDKAGEGAFRMQRDVYISLMAFKSP